MRGACVCACVRRVVCGMQTIVDNMRLNNEGREISEDRVKGFNSLEEANAWLLENPEMTGKPPSLVAAHACVFLCLSLIHI